MLGAYQPFVACCRVVSHTENGMSYTHSFDICLGVLLFEWKHSHSQLNTHTHTGKRTEWENVVDVLRIAATFACLTHNEQINRWSINAFLDAKASAAWMCICNNPKNSWCGIVSAVREWRRRYACLFLSIESNRPTQTYLIWKQSAFHAVHRSHTSPKCAHLLFFLSFTIRAFILYFICPDLECVCVWIRICLTLTAIAWNVCTL